MSLVCAAFCALRNNVKVDNEVHLSFPFDTVNAFRPFPVGEYVQRLSGYRKLSLGVTIMIFIGLFYALMVSGLKHKSSAYCSFLAINMLPHSLDLLACLCGGVSASMLLLKVY